MSDPTLTAILTEEQLKQYETELTAASTKKNNYNTNNTNNNNSELALKITNQLTEDIKALESKINQYNNAIKAQKLPRNRKERNISAVINPLLGLGWPTLLSIGIILQETVKVTTSVLSTFLFPLHFTLEGIRSIWSLYRTARDSDLAHRKTIFGTNFVHILGLIAAATVTALAVTNPFALPVIFIGLNGAGLYRNAYILRQTNQSIQSAEKALVETSAKIKAHTESIFVLNPDDPTPDTKLNALLASEEAKSKRLTTQLTNLKAQRFELRREMVFNSLGMVAVGLFLASAVLTVIFPPAAAGLTAVGMMFFAGTALANILTSPPVRNKAKQIGTWVKGLFSSKDEPHLAEAGLAAQKNNVSEVKEEPLMASPVAKIEAANDPTADENATASPASTNGRSRAESTASVSNLSIFKPRTGQDPLDQESKRTIEPAAALKTD